ncbi:25S rRNA (cytosine-C(5))-methyltransferase rcm1 [Exophiala dermatitidis]
MSLYYDAATVLTNDGLSGSLKSRIYGNKLELKSKPAHLYALISETAKFDGFLKEVIDNAGLLAQEPKLNPTLSLLLVHDHLLSKSGIAASSSHPLRQAIERHKARLQAEFTKARLRRKCATVDDLKRHLLKEKPPTHRSQPRWIRINTLKTSIDEQLATTFNGFRRYATVAEVVESASTDKILAIDENIPNVIALPPEADVTKTEAYKLGKLILQDKASCFPAFLLVGEGDGGVTIGDCIDGCAAPGNKTSHLAGILASSGHSTSRIYACERDATRSKILKSMMEKSGAEKVKVLFKQDFLALDPQSPKYKNVTHLVLDPSCSGSGIVGREDVPTLALPLDPRQQKAQAGKHAGNLKKRKRGREEAQTERTIEHDSLEAEETKEAAPNQERLQKLSALQTMIVEHALSFPSATRITYSTCSLHVEENEAVVSRILSSKNAISRGWRVLRRDEQPDGLRQWEHRGVTDPPIVGSRALSEGELEACIRCYPDNGDGTMGFFVCGFVRDDAEDRGPNDADKADEADHVDDDWEGFSE